MSTLELSKSQARKLVLLAQGLPPVKQKLNALDSTLSAIHQLGYVQIDTISSIQRAHHHTLWNRNPLYAASHLSDLMQKQQVFEYWSHAAAYLPMKDYRYSLPRKQAIASGKEKHWYTPNEHLMDDVLRRIEAEGPLMAKDFDHAGDKFGEWQTKPAKQALENLFMQGFLMIRSRNNFHKVYDLPSRVLPSGLDTSVPTADEQARFLIKRYLKANGIGQAAEIAYLLKNTKSLISSNLTDMLENEELITVKVGAAKYCALSDALGLLEKPLAKSKLKILSPFDNLLIQRKRTKELFDFDYLLECYVPAAKRKFGYFVLPVLWDGKLVARMDCKADRKTKVLHIHNLAIESSLLKIDAFAQALFKELVPFLKFNECDVLELHETYPSAIHALIEDALKPLIIQNRGI
ncbi:winged helix-turn-helix domain-containing protein [Carboxylicivirga sp. M1479]|uniref:winged helix-turn-helix domain-containing protein n=1 Tax=Carboxylicivirga sp. M1479 TaxID=2594476 RepID=UPI001178857C|nr:crosslink repair DNA glycosylase YcaQ family protein [Carboxylicivirga sp. M1479]TRX71002.1 winged helix-turn-helix domain-containing protein [Carboxylicivirga sp. M1479]